MIVYVMRHGITDWNEQKRLQGNSNTSLNESGVRMAVEAAEGLVQRKIFFDIIYSSPLSRALETAKIIKGDRDIPLITDDRLKEIGFGIDEGVEVPFRTPGCKLFFTDPPAYVPAEGAESFESLIARTGDFIDSVIRPLSVTDPGKTVLISGHGALNKALALNFLKRDLKDFWAGELQTNCSAAVYEVNDRDVRLIADGITFDAKAQ